jgi:hypothetical protein
MKWFRHQADTSDDEFINALESEFDYMGYAVWHKICESIAKIMDSTDRCYAEYSIEKWLGITRIKRASKLIEFLEFCQKFRRNSGENTEIIQELFYENNGKILKISVPKLLKYKDEYAKKSGQSTRSNPDNVPEIPIIDTDTDTDKKEDSLRSSSKGNDDFDFEFCMRAWNEATKETLVPGAVTGCGEDKQRKVHLRKLVKFLEKHYGIPWQEAWERYARAIVANHSLASGNNKSGWVANLKYAINPNNTSTILEKINANIPQQPAGINQNEFTYASRLADILGTGGGSGESPSYKLVGQRLPESYTSDTYSTNSRPKIS